jgi:hypothetical protein
MLVLMRLVAGPLALAFRSFASTQGVQRRRTGQVYARREAALLLSIPGSFRS